MRQRLHLLHRQTTKSARSGKWGHLFHVKLLGGGVTLAGILFYAADAISQNALGQLGMSIIQSLFAQLQALMAATGLYVIIVLLILIIILQQIRYLWLQKKYKRLERDARLNGDMVQIDHHVLTQLLPLMHIEEKGEEHEQ